MTKFAEDVRRIAKQDKIKGGLPTAQDRDSIPGDSSEFPFSLYSSAEDATTPAEGTNTEGVPPTEDNADSYDKGDASDGLQDATDVIDGTAGYVDGSLFGLDGLTDCATGDDIIVRFDDLYPNPDDWDDPDTPPITWTGSVVDEFWYTAPPWTYEYPGASVGSGWSTCYDRAFNQFCTIGGANTIEQYRLGNSASIWGDPVTNGDGEITRAVYVWRIIEEGQSDDYGGWGFFDGSIGYGDYYEPTEWDSDNAWNIALVDGMFTSHEYDPDAPSGWTPRSVMDFCFDSSRTGRLYVTSSGGVMITETSGGTPTGTAKVYNPDGTFHSEGDADDTFMDQFLPR